VPDGGTAIWVNAGVNSAKLAEKAERRGIHLSPEVHFSVNARPGSGFRIPFSRYSPAELEEAMERLAKNRPNLIILDINLPGTNGLDLARQIRAGNCQAKLLMLSGETDPWTVQQALAIGRSLMANPRLVLLDEVSLGLAPVVIKRIYEAMEALPAKGTTILVVEQDVQHVLTVADRVACFLAGRISLEGPPSDMTPEAITAAYFGM